jgi:hypothetical protein
LESPLVHVLLSVVEAPSTHWAGSEWRAAPYQQVRLTSLLLLIQEAEAFEIRLPSQGESQ